MYNGNSIVDYLKSTGQSSDFASRVHLAASRGISGYTGSAEQNTQLLNLLKGSSPVSTSQSAPSQSITPSQSTFTSSGTAGGWQSLPGYAGWDPVAAEADFKATGGVGKGGATPGSSSTSPSSALAGVNPSGFFTAPTIDLPGLYDNLYASSGIKDVENDLSAKSRAHAEAVAGIKDNPYLSEATMSGRIKKADDKFNADTANIRGDIAMRKADIETKLNLQTKQFDIQSQQATQALNMFNTLLSSGALDGASGEDIANITRSTGLSSSIVQSAINANKAKNVQTSTISFDDGRNQGFAVINSKTGEIISKQTVATSKPASTATSGTANSKESFQSTASTLAPKTINGQYWGVFPQLIQLYAPYLSLEEIRKLYLQSAPGKLYGEPKENSAEMKQLYDYVRTGKQPN